VSKRYKPRQAVFAVVRVDECEGLPEAIDSHVTVHQVVRSLDVAEREAERLNALNGPKGCVYFTCAAQLLPEGVGKGHGDCVSIGEDIPLLRFDPECEAIIEPSVNVKLRDVPERCVITFFREVVERLKEDLALEPLPPLRSEMADVLIYRGIWNGEVVGVSEAAVGAPLAGGLLEEIIARGGRKFVACGSAGVLDPTIAEGRIVVPDTAIRDEGTSYHYLPADREARASQSAVATIRSVLDERGVPYLVGRTWTTDGIYRETASRVARRRAQGALTVEMEAAAYFAVAEFRGVTFGQLLYGGDDVSGEEWDRRSHGQKSSAREKLFRLALEACLRL